MATAATGARSTMAEIVRKRLGGKFAVRVSDVAAACDVSVTTVYDWIDDGTLQAVDLNKGRPHLRPFYQVRAESVVELYERGEA